MLSNGATSALLSGSGPSVFGIFSSVVAAENVCNELKAYGYEAHVCNSL